MQPGQIHIISLNRGIQPAKYKPQSVCVRRLYPGFDALQKKLPQSFVFEAVYLL